MKKYTIRGNYPSGCECSGDCRWVEIEAKSQKTAEDKARLYFSQAIRITTQAVAIAGKNEQKNARCIPCKIRENENK
jgi:hypothetical protein